MSFLTYGYNTIPVSFFGSYVLTLDIIGFLLFLNIATYIYFAYSLYIVGKKTSAASPWRAWVPILNYFLELEIADLSYAWLLPLLIPIVIVLIEEASHGGLAIANLSFLLKILAWINMLIFIYIWARISEHVGKSPWLGIFMVVPIANYLTIGHLAFSKGPIAMTFSSNSITSSVGYGKKWEHPELQQGESFLGNYSESDFTNKLRWQTKRLGTVAYDRYGNKESDISLRPVFVRTEELQKAGLSY